MNMSVPVRNTLNFLIFQTGWLVCAIWPGNQAALFALFLVGLHLIFVSHRRRTELLIIIVGSALGVALDTAWRHAGILVFPESQIPVAGTIPAWLICIWLLFLTTVNHMLAWVARSPFTLWLLPPLAGPFAYFSAARLGAVDIGFSPWGLIGLGVGWLVLYPSLVALSQWLFQKREVDAVV